MKIIRTVSKDTLWMKVNRIIVKNINSYTYNSVNRKIYRPTNTTLWPLILNTAYNE